MNNKRQQISKRINALLEFSFIKMEQYQNGLLTEEQMNEALNYIDSVNDEIQAEIAIIELLDNVCLN